MISRVDGTRLPGASSPFSIRRRSSAAIRAYGGVKGFAPMGNFSIMLRNLSMRSMTRWPMRQILEKQFAKAGAFTLPDYE
ncbi:MAG TPA: hypothetical protein VHX59_11890 [Mycobacteriales bacterium]|nr:hypothetical protein [Mycobacteriales bacterium]